MGTEFHASPSLYFSACHSMLPTFDDRSPWVQHCRFPKSKVPPHCSDELESIMLVANNTCIETAVAIRYPKHARQRVQKTMTSGICSRRYGALFHQQACLSLISIAWRNDQLMAQKYHCRHFLSELQPWFLSVKTGAHVEGVRWLATGSNPMDELKMRLLEKTAAVYYGEGKDALQRV